MDVDLYINGFLRTDLKVRRITQSYVQPGSCELAYVGRHDRYPVEQYSWVIVRRSGTGQSLFRGNIMEVSPGGVASEGIAFLAQERRFRLENEPVNINGSGVYMWNARGSQCDSESGEDSPGRDGGKWTAGEVIIDILEHALGIPPGGSDIPGHHSSAGCVTGIYLTAQDIMGYNASDFLALDSVIGEFSVDNTPVAQAIQELVALNGGFYGWYIDPTGVLVVRNLKALPETNVEAGELGHWQDEAGRSYALLDNKLNWSLDGVYTSVMVQGTDKTVEVKPANLDGCANAALNGGGELELVNAPWKGYLCAYRALNQPYRVWTAKSVGFEGSCIDWEHVCECGVPAGASGIVHTARIYRGTDAGPKTYVRASEHQWIVNCRTGIIMFLTDMATDLAPGEKLWGWYWARMPFTVTAGPAGTAYDCQGYERTGKYNDPAFRDVTSYPLQGTVDDQTAMGILAARLLEQFQDIRIQGQIQCDEVDPVAYNLDQRYNVTRLGRPTTTTLGPTTTSQGPTTTTAACWPNPLDWGRLGLNAVEVTHDFEQNLTEITLANTFFMLEGYSALRQRLELNLFANRELNLSEEILACQVIDPSVRPHERPTITEGPTTTTTTAAPTTTTTVADCNGCSPPIPDTLYVTLCGMGSDWTQYNGVHGLAQSNGAYCQWYVHLLGTATLYLEYDAGNTRWIVRLQPYRGTSCRKRWVKSDPGGCTPQGGTYTELDCLDWTCWTGHNCPDSAGATCAVSLAGGGCPTTTTQAPYGDCGSRSADCFMAAFSGACDGMNFGGLYGGIYWSSQGGMIGGMPWAGSIADPAGTICQWTGDLINTSGVSPWPNAKVDLFFHPVIGWFLSCEQAYWQKNLGRMNASVPTGGYTCITGGVGTAQVTKKWCTPPTTTSGPPPTTTTQAPPPPTTTTTSTTTTKAPTTTTTQAPTTTVAPPTTTPMPPTTTPMPPTTTPPPPTSTTTQTPPPPPTTSTTTQAPTTSTTEAPTTTTEAPTTTTGAPPTTTTTEAPPPPPTNCSQLANCPVPPYHAQYKFLAKCLGSGYHTVGSKSQCWWGDGGYHVLACDGLWADSAHFVARMSDGDSECRFQRLVSLGIEGLYVRSMDDCDEGNGCEAGGITVVAV